MTYELSYVILSIIVSTDLVSNFVQANYTTGIAHVIYNGFTVLPDTEANHHQDDEVVSFGVLAVLTVDGQFDERDKILRFSRPIGLPTRLADIHTSPADLPAAAEKALAEVSVRKYLYEATKDTTIYGIIKLDEYNGRTK